MNPDMSPGAITERLKLMSALTTLCLALGKARPVAESIVRGEEGDAPSPTPGPNRPEQRPPRS